MPGKIILHVQRANWSAKGDVEAARRWLGKTGNPGAAQPTDDDADRGARRAIISEIGGQPVDDRIMG